MMIIVGIKSNSPIYTVESVQLKSDGTPVIIFISECCYFLTLLRNDVYGAQLLCTAVDFVSHGFQVRENRFDVSFAEFLA